VECEYAVVEEGRLVDFRTLLDELAMQSELPLIREGARSYRFANGHRLSCDGWYGELATPPEALAPGAASRLADSVVRTRDWLVGAVGLLGHRSGRELAVFGHSTHLSVGAGRVAERESLARRLLLEFGPLLILLTC